VAAVWRDSLAHPGKEAVPTAAALSRGAIAREKDEKNTLKIPQIQNKSLRLESNEI
jgi:hypothetical protein